MARRDDAITHTAVERAKWTWVWVFLAGIAVGGAQWQLFDHGSRLTKIENRQEATSADQQETVRLLREALDELRKK